VQSAANGGQQQPAPKGAPSSVEPVAFEGKTWEAMTPFEKHQLHERDPQAYADLKANYVERGSPRAQSQQQRASA